jgi:hypothetical protein
MGVVTCICRDAYLLGQPGTRLIVAALKADTGRFADEDG